MRPRGLAFQGSKTRTLRKHIPDFLRTALEVLDMGKSCWGGGWGADLDVASMSCKLVSGIPSFRVIIPSRTLPRTQYLCIYIYATPQLKYSGFWPELRFFGQTGGDKFFATLKRTDWTLNSMQIPTKQNLSSTLKELCDRHIGVREVHLKSHWSMQSSLWQLQLTKKQLSSTRVVRFGSLNAPVAALLLCVSYFCLAANFSKSSTWGKGTHSYFMSLRNCIFMLTRVLRRIPCT